MVKNAAIDAYLMGTAPVLNNCTPVMQLVNEQAPMVRRIALHMADRMDHRLIDVDDLIQIGFIGLLEAANRYDATTGVPFEAFALTRVRGAMMDELRKHDWCPRSLRQQGKSIRQARMTLEQQHGRQVTSREVADFLDMPANTVNHAEARIEAANRLSLETLCEDRGDSWDEIGTDHEAPVAPLLKAASSKELALAIQALPEREQIILHLYYDKEMNLKEIARALDLTEARICQLRKKALTALNTSLKANF
ncbi:sigma-70 family RNA polymerase sigma factor [Parendozoicomonas haliclonae]|uniref:RNA polymerase sigma factor FliA n=1 Tax=Parendozoicomonas haliclonae TaxID=1960125 RepID=A0A1X7AN23_9GAMM|nr:FliA/WhiG family RNA polymerase sigma factor [Parendozoicomonas haliclonae]SMA49675.1 RNA polymerase sigma factor FliA [Parendozoicomonas haliclonae]